MNKVLLGLTITIWLAGTACKVAIEHMPPTPPSSKPPIQAVAPAPAPTPAPVPAPKAAAQVKDEPHIDVELNNRVKALAIKNLNKTSTTTTIPPDISGNLNGGSSVNNVERDFPSAKSLGISQLDGTTMVQNFDTSNSKWSDF